MKYIHFHVSNSCCGCSHGDIAAVPDFFTEKDIDDMVYNIACDNAEAYAYIYFGWGYNYTEREWEEYIENKVNFDWYYLTQEEYLKKQKQLY